MGYGTAVFVPPATRMAMIFVFRIRAFHSVGFALQDKVTALAHGELWKRTNETVSQSMPSGVLNVWSKSPPALRRHVR